MEFKLQQKILQLSLILVLWISFERFEYFKAPGRLSLANSNQERWNKLLFLFQHWHYPYAVKLLNYFIKQAFYHEIMDSISFVYITFTW